MCRRAISKMLERRLFAALFQVPVYRMVSLRNYAVCMQSSYLQSLIRGRRSNTPYLSLGGVAVALFAGKLAYDNFVREGFLILALALTGVLFWQYRRAVEIAQLAKRLSKTEFDTKSAAPITKLRASVRQVEQQLDYLNARMDERHGVTGLPTRELLLSRMADDRSGILGVISFIDFNRLCAFDPAMADRALIEFAKRITRMIGEDRLVAHVDRSDFVVWFGPGELAADVEAQLVAVCYALGDVLADECLDLIPEPRVHHAAFSADIELPGHLLSRALAACAAGAKVPTSVAKVDALSVDRERERYSLEQDLRAALTRNEFELLFQPQVDAASGRVLGAEALLRWNCPARGMISPGMFVPLLESAGLIDEAGVWALNTACREARTWQSREVGVFSVAVNVSSCQLDRGDLDRRIERMLETHQLPARAIEIELTETAAAADITRAAQFFGSLRSKGIRSAIDDFGTGFSSLSSLRALAFDKIKIDREFVTEVDRRRDSQAICQSIIALARGLGIRVLAEGVERPEEYLWLRKHGCNEFQGYYFSKPISSSGFRAYFQDRSALSALLAPDPIHPKIKSTKGFAS